MAILIEGLDLPKIEKGEDLLSINIKPNGDVIKDMDIECRVIAHAVEPKRGRWETKYGDPVHMELRPLYIFCSNCGQVSTVMWNYCPNCGEDMRGGRNG